MLLNGDIDFFIVTDFPADKFEENLLVNSMLVRGSGAIESVATVPAMRAANAEAQKRKRGQIFDIDNFWPNMGYDENDTAAEMDKNGIKYTFYNV